MNPRDSSRSTDDDAARWVVRMDRGVLPPAEEAALQAWLAGDARRPGALLRAKAIFLQTDAARALDKNGDETALAPVDTHASSRRTLLRRAAAIAGLTTVAGMGLSFLVGEGGRAYATERGEIRHIPLPDGSVMILNTATQVRVGYDQAQRHVRLIEGEVLFRAAADTRPFLVDVGAQRLAAMSGEFLVRNLAGQPLCVMVHEGQVSAGSAREDRRAVALSPGTALTPNASGAVRITIDDMARQTAWRDGKIDLQGETLAEAAAMFARYGDPKIVIVDPALAGESVTGLFAANDPVGFCRAIGVAFDARVSLQRQTVVLHR